MVVDSDPLRRFSSRAGAYVRYRPSYPPQIVELLVRDCGLSRDSVVADVGSGTGLLTKIFLDFGCRVYGVEPNPEMREAGEEFLSGRDRFHSMNGQAENTGLPPGSVDLVSAGQAFHWFAPERARAEFRRILREPKWVALVWNERLVTGHPFLEGYERLLQRYAPEYAKVDHRRVDTAALSQFFGASAWKTVTLENQQRFDLDGVRGRLLSSSYAPPAGATGHEEMIGELERLFAATEQDGCVVFAYHTRLHYGPLAP